MTDAARLHQVNRAAELERDAEALEGLLRAEFYHPSEIGVIRCIISDNRIRATRLRTAIAIADLGSRSPVQAEEEQNT